MATTVVAADHLVDGGRDVTLDRRFDRTACRVIGGQVTQHVLHAPGTREVQAIQVRDLRISRVGYVGGMRDLGDFGNAGPVLSPREAFLFFAFLEISRIKALQKCNFKRD